MFLVHGSWPDNAYLWVDDLQEALHARGVESISVPHGVVVGLGTGSPASRLAELGRDLVERHARTRCQAPLRLVGVGYSSGTDVLRDACLAGVPFERCYFAGSPISLWNDDLRQALKSGRMQTLVNYYSPLDGLVWVPMGSGVFGYHGAGWEVVDNRLHFWPHVMPLWNRGYAVAALVEEVLQAGAGEAPHTCFREPAYAAWYRAARERLRTDWSEREERAPRDRPPPHAGRSASTVQAGFRPR